MTAAKMGVQLWWFRPMWAECIGIFAA
jgi:hypothetical protein